MITYKLISTNKQTTAKGRNGYFNLNQLEVLKFDMDVEAVTIYGLSARTDGEPPIIINLTNEKAIELANKIKELVAGK